MKNKMIKKNEWKHKWKKMINKMINKMITKTITKMKKKYFNNFQCVAGSVFHNCSYHGGFDLLIYNV